MEELEIKRVGIVLVNYKNWEDTIECSESLLQSTFENYIIVIVDNNSQNDSCKNLNKWLKGELSVIQSKKSPILDRDVITSESREGIQSRSDSSNLKSKIILIESDTNNGFASGNNIAIKYLRKHQDIDYFWILNNDTVVKPDTLSNLVRSSVNINPEEKIGMLGNPIFYFYNPSTVQAIGGKVNKRFCSTSHVGEGHAKEGLNKLDTSQVDYVFGASMFVFKEYIDDVGLMDESLFLYFEEIDWIERGKKNGWTFSICLNAFVYHKEGGATGSNTNVLKKSKLSDTYSIKNRLIISTRYFRKHLFTIYLSTLFVVFNRLIRGQFDRAFFTIRMLIESVISTFKKN